jgi:hypothetical protein
MFIKLSYLLLVFMLSLTVGVNFALAQSAAGVCPVGSAPTLAPGQVLRCSNGEWHKDDGVFGATIIAPREIAQQVKDDLQSRGVETLLLLQAPGGSSATTIILPWPFLIKAFEGESLYRERLGYLEVVIIGGEM